jgi:hypothetical protein
MHTMLKAFLVFVLAAAVLAVAYFAFVLNWSYSSGERAGWVQKFSKKGWICKTWEGELALVSLPGSAVEKFHFTVHDDVVAGDINRLIGKRVALHYEQKVGLPTSCFGETRYFVSKITETTDIPLAPGVTLPQAVPSAPATMPTAPTMQAPPAAAPAAATPPLPATPAASR